MIRLYVEADLADGVEAPLGPDQIHYLRDVMRLGEGGEFLAFNGRDGEWRVRLKLAGKREGCFAVLAQTRVQSLGPDLDLIVAVVKRARLEAIAEKAAELGARRIRPVTTERTNAGRANPARLFAIAREAAEQTGRLDAPEVAEQAPLARVLGEWPAGRRLMFCDEAGEAAPALQALAEAGGGSWAILIGPEGGFSSAEREAIRAAPGAVPVSLGPRILRADTAAIAALSLWQAALGDWRSGT